MTPTPDPEHSPDTIAQYQKIFASLYKRANREQEETLDSLSFIQWLGNLRPGLSKRTWWSYKAATVYCLSERRTTHGENHSQALEVLTAMTAKPCRKKTTNTSGGKDKKLAQKDLLTLCLYLDNRSGNWGVRTSLWLIAGYLTGLRPLEWTQSEWTTIQAHPALKVRNAKASHDRAHGVFRHLIFANWDEQVITLVRRHWQELLTFSNQKDYYTYYDNCRNTLYRATRSCFPERKKFPTLYSARHQFAADMKKNHSAQIAAALMGHKTDTTVQRMYAQSRVGEERGGGIAPLPLAVQGEVARVEVSKDTVSLLNSIRIANANHHLLIPKQ